MMLCIVFFSSYILCLIDLAQCYWNEGVGLYCGTDYAIQVPVPAVRPPC